MIVSSGKSASSDSRAPLQPIRGSRDCLTRFKAICSSPTMALLFFWCTGKGTI